MFLEAKNHSIDFHESPSPENRRITFQGATSILHRCNFNYIIIRSVGHITIPVFSIPVERKNKNFPD